MTKEKNPINISVTDVKKIGDKKKKLLSPKTIFGLIVVFLLYAFVLIASNIWIDVQGNEDPNIFHEIIGILILLGLGFLAYFKVFKKKLGIVQKKIDEAQKAEEDAKKLLDEKLKDGIKLIKGGGDTMEKIDGIHRLITVALEIPEERQFIVNLLEGQNHWMGKERSFLTKQNLVTWRLRGTIFPEIDENKQRISLEVITGLEKIIKKHAIDFKLGRTMEMLDLSSKYLPAMNLGFIELLPGSIILDFAFLWQTSFWQGQILDISFVSSELQGANFWRCYLEQVDLGGANLRDTKLKTDLTAVTNFSPAQFFSSHEWQINVLNEHQIQKFFPDQSKNNTAWGVWQDAESNRKLLLTTINNPLYDHKS